MHIVLHYHAAEEGGLLSSGRLFNWDGEDLLLVWADDRRQGCSRFRFYLQGTVTYPVRILPNSSKD